MVSKNGIALLVLVAEALLTAIGVEFEVGTVQRAVEGVLVAVSLILMAWNQYDRSEIKWFVFKH